MESVVAKWCEAIRAEQRRSREERRSDEQLRTAREYIVRTNGEESMSWIDDVIEEAGLRRAVARAPSALSNGASNVSTDTLGLPTPISRSRANSIFPASGESSDEDFFEDSRRIRGAEASSSGVDSGIFDMSMSDGASERYPEITPIPSRPNFGDHSIHRFSFTFTAPRHAQHTQTPPATPPARLFGNFSTPAASSSSPAAGNNAAEDVPSRSNTNLTTAAAVNILATSPLAPIASVSPDPALLPTAANTPPQTPSTQPSQCTIEHPARRTIAEEDCGICRETLMHSTLPELVWCKAAGGCGKSVHLDCFEPWRRRAQYSDDVLTCIFCRKPWKNCPQHDLVELPYAMWVEDRLWDPTFFEPRSHRLDIWSSAFEIDFPALFNPRTHTERFDMWDDGAYNGLSQLFHVGATDSDF